MFVSSERAFVQSTGVLQSAATVLQVFPLTFGEHYEVHLAQLGPTPAFSQQILTFPLIEQPSAAIKSYGKLAKTITKRAIANFLIFLRLS